MTRFVLGPDVALLLAERRAKVAPRHKLLAPTLLRSQVLAQLYGQVLQGQINQTEAKRRLDHIRQLAIRLLGDRVLQQLAWDMAAQLGWPDTFVAEYLALTRLQADALVTRDASLAQTAGHMVRMASVDELLA